MWATAIVGAALLNFLTPSTAFFAALQKAPRVSRIPLASASESLEYQTLLANVKKSTPAGSVIVIKYGGHAMENEELKRFFCEDIAALCSVSISLFSSTPR